MRFSCHLHPKQTSLSAMQKWFVRAELQRGQDSFKAMGLNLDDASIIVEDEEGVSDMTTDVVAENEAKWMQEFWSARVTLVYASDSR